MQHYRVIQSVTESGAFRLTDTWKFKHHALKTPTVTSADRIVQATKNLTSAIQGGNKTGTDKLAAIANLRLLITGSSNPAPIPATPTQLQPVPVLELAAPSMPTMNFPAILE